MRIFILSSIFLFNLWKALESSMNFKTEFFLGGEELYDAFRRLQLMLDPKTNKNKNVIILKLKNKQTNENQKVYL
jgi:hypothetical protein